MTVARSATTVVWNIWYAPRRGLQNSPPRKTVDSAPPMVVQPGVPFPASGAAWFLLVQAVPLVDVGLTSSFLRDPFPAADATDAVDRLALVVTDSDLASISADAKTYTC